jgi:hypothetical protein
MQMHKLQEQAGKHILGLCPANNLTAIALTVILEVSNANEVESWRAAELAGHAADKRDE